MRSIGSITKSAAGVAVLALATMVPIPSVTSVTLTPVFLVKASATSLNPPPVLTAAPSTRISWAGAGEANASASNATQATRRMSISPIECSTRVDLASLYHCHAGTGNHGNFAFEDDSAGTDDGFLVT